MNIDIKAKYGPLNEFVASRRFEIPIYQRDYAWEETHIKALLSDIAEALDTGRRHFLGTFIVRCPDAENQPYQLVDGQQRLTTVLVLAFALCRRLGDPPREWLTLADGSPCLKLAGASAGFFAGLVRGGASPEPTNGSQRRLLDAHDLIRREVEALSMPDVNRWLECIGKLEVLHLEVRDYGRAIHMFQTLNDRGKPLSCMEKAKSLLISYSFRFLNGSLDDFVNDAFGEMYRSHAAMKDVTKRCHMRPIADASFAEDSVMAFHAVAYWDSRNEHEALSWLKSNLKRDEPTKGNPTTNKLEGFIRDYVSDLKAFFDGLRDLADRASANVGYYKLVSTLGLSSLLYPLAVRLMMRKLLDTDVRTIEGMSYLALLTTVEIRAFKMGQSEAVRTWAAVARDARLGRLQEVLAALRKACVEKSGRFEELARQNKESPAVRLLLMSYEEKLSEKRRQSVPLEVVDIQRLEEYSVERWLPYGEELPSRGFGEGERCHEYRHLGNLTLIEEPLLKRAGSHGTPEEKALVYAESTVASTRRVAKGIGKSPESPRPRWSKDDIDRRTKTLMKLAEELWPMP